MADYYHVAPAAARHLIEQEGITPWHEGRDFNFELFDPRPYVHMWPDLQKAREFALKYADVYPDVHPTDPAYDQESLRGLDEHPTADIWHVKHDGPVEPDDRLNDAVMTSESIHPHNANHVDSIYLSDMPKYQNECEYCGRPTGTDSLYCEPNCPEDEHDERIARIDGKIAKATVQAAGPGDPTNMFKTWYGEPDEGLKPASNHQRDQWQNRGGAYNHSHRVPYHLNAPYIENEHGARENVLWRKDARRSDFHIYPGERVIVPNPAGTTPPVMEVPQGARSCRVNLESYGFAPGKEGMVAGGFYVNGWY